MSSTEYDGWKRKKERSGKAELKGAKKGEENEKPLGATKSFTSLSIALSLSLTHTPSFLPSHIVSCQEASPSSPEVKSPERALTDIRLMFLKVIREQE